MLSDDDIDDIMNIFYAEAPHDFIIAVEFSKPKRLRGECYFDDKACVIYSPETYEDALWVTLHELAHARIQHRTHSEMWDAEFVRLLKKYEFPPELVSSQAEAIGPNLRKFMLGIS